MDPKEYAYDLPEELIAQRPAPRRDGSRLMVLDRNSGRVSHGVFSDLAEWLPEGALLVVNDARVVPVRLFGRRPTGGRVEVVILEPPGPESGPGQYWLECLARPARRLKSEEPVEFGEGLSAEYVRPGREGCRVLKFHFRDHPLQVLERLGRMPTPPYIRRDGNPAEADLDRERYQTTYARNPGAVAAPTAGLHFTPDVFQALAARGVETAAVTLMVGYGTFAPLRPVDLERKRLHLERVKVSEETADKVIRAKAEGRPVVAVGTTSVRALEHVAGTGGMRPFDGATDLFIYPGVEFRVVDHLVTNFHLPGSSLMFLVAAFAGRKPILDAYRTAVSERYSFFSYGDAMLIL